MGVKSIIRSIVSGGTAPVGEKSERNRDLNQQLDEYVQAGLTVTRDWLVMWRDALNYTFNNQLYDQDWPEGWPRIASNYIYPAFEQAKAILSQRRPQMVTKPWDGGQADIEGAKFWQSVLQFQFQKALNMPYLCLDAYMDSAIFGYCVGKVTWDAQSQWNAERVVEMGPDGQPLPPKPPRWIGAPRVRMVHPAYFGVDPEAENIQDAAYIFSRRRVRVEWAKQKWPKHAKAIEAASTVGDGTDEFWGSMQQQMEPTFYSDQKGKGLPSSVEGRLAAMMSWGNKSASVRYDGQSGVMRPTYVTVEEVSWRDDEQKKNFDNEQVPKEELMESGALMYDQDVPKNPAGDILTEENWPIRTAAEWEEPVYPHGRFVLRVGPEGKQTILNGTPEEQIWPYRQWPFIVGVNSALPHMWQGLNGVEMSRGLQDFQNKTLSHMLNAIRHFADPCWVEEGGALMDNADLTAEPGKILKVNPGKMDGVRRMDGASMDGSIFSVYEALGKELRDQGGMQEIGLGRQGAQKTFGEANMLLQSSRQRTALQSFHLDLWVVAVMERVAELIQRNMTEGDVLRVAGDEGAPTAQAISAGMLDVKYDIALDVGTALPFDREQKKRELAELFGILSSLPAAAVALLPNLLEVFEIDNADAIVQKVEEAMKAQAEAEAKQAESEAKQAEQKAVAA